MPAKKIPKNAKGGSRNGIVPVSIADAREIAVNVVYEVLEKGAYANLSLDKALRGSHLSPQDKHLVTEIVNGSIRMIKHLDWVLNLFLQKPISKQNPWLRNILRMAAYQLLFMERIPDYAVVNTAVEMSRKKTSKALAGVCNGVLRNLLRQQGDFKYPPFNSPEYLAVYYSQPEWLVEKWLTEFGLETTVAMFIYLNKRAEISLRANRLKTDPAHLLDDLNQEGIEASLSPLLPYAVRIKSLEKNIEQLKSYQEGHFYIQNEASMLAGAILDPQPGERIVDLCCGVGGKTTHFAEIMNNYGRIHAIELYEHKTALLEKNCQRLGITIVEAHNQNILLMEEPAPQGHRVFLDVPCSGLGVLHRRADSRWKKQPEEIQELCQLQRELIQKAGQMVAPGGVLVYATCTNNQAENEGIVEAFLCQNPAYKLEDFSRLISFLPLDQNDQDAARSGMLSLLPGQYDTDGMFYARLRRSRT